MIDNSWLIRLLRLINAGAPPDTLFRQFSAELASTINLWTIQVYHFDRLGNLTLSNWYGISEEQLDGYRVIEPDANIPINDCKVSGELLILSSREEIAKRYPVSSSWPFIPASIACIPLRIGDTLEGVLGLSFKDPLRVNEDGVIAEIVHFFALAEICQLCYFSIIRRAH